MTDDGQRKRPSEDEILAGDPQVASAVHAVDQMLQVVDDLETYVWTTHFRDAHGTRYRLNLLWLHALAALLVAPLLSLTGRAGMSGPSFAFLRELPGTPYSLATVLGTGGLVLGWGCVFRAKRTEMAGLALLGVFYLIFAVSFAIPAVRWLFVDQAGVKPPMYGPVVYGHLCAIMAAHIAGLVYVRRDMAAIAAIRRQQGLPAPPGQEPTP